MSQAVEAKRIFTGVPGDITRFYRGPSDEQLKQEPGFSLQIDGVGLVSVIIERMQVRNSGAHAVHCLIEDGERATRTSTVSSSLSGAIEALDARLKIPVRRYLESTRKLTAK